MAASKPSAKTMTTIQRHLSPEIALALAQRALAHAGGNNWQVAVAVVDAGGNLLAFVRHAGVQTLSIGFAVDKAYTAALLQRSTLDFAKRAASKPPLAMGLANRKRVLVFPGGVPVTIDGEVVGGIGVSGAADMDDIACAEKALSDLLG